MHFCHAIFIVHIKLKHICGAFEMTVHDLGLCCPCVIYVYVKLMTNIFNPLFSMGFHLISSLSQNMTDT